MTEREEQLYAVVNRLVERHVYRLPVDVEGLCRLYGASLLSYAEAVERSVLTRGDIAALAGTRDGFTLDAGGEWAVVYNERLPLGRRRFTFAEELMHRLLLHSQDDDFLCGSQRWTEETYAAYETEARRAAGMLLVPPTVYYRFRRVCSCRRIAALCEVSEACARSAARCYDAQEDEILAAFTKKRIECDAAALPPRTRRARLISPAE